MRLVLLLALLVPAGAARGIMPPREAEPPDARVAENGAAEAAVPSYSVIGKTLRGRFEVAADHAGKRFPAAPSWIGWSFEVRADGDPVAVESGEQLPAEPRRAALLLEMSPGASAPGALRIVSQDRTRRQGQALYWLGRATVSESLDFLKALARPPAPAALAGDAVRAIGLHHHAAVPALLGSMARRSSIAAVRTAALDSLVRRWGREGLALATAQAKLTPPGGEARLAR